MKFLLDTDTLIYWMKNVPEVVDNIARHRLSSLAASVISRAELYFGAYNLNFVDRNVAAIRKLSKVIEFLPFDERAQELYGRIKAELRSAGKRLDDADLFIAATALSSRRTLVTNNEGHFSRIENLHIANWAKS